MNKKVNNPSWSGYVNYGGFLEKEALSLIAVFEDAENDASNPIQNTMIEAHTPLGEYMKRGGFIGVANDALIDELRKAEGDASHVLYPVILALQNGDKGSAAILLCAALIPYVEEDNNPLKGCAVRLVIARSLDMVKFAEDNYDDDETLTLAGITQTAIRWAGVGLGLKASKAAAGRKKGKGWERKVIEAWKASRKRSSATAFATILYTRWGGETNEDGNKLKHKDAPPAVRTMAKYINQYQKNNAAF